DIGFKVVYLGTKYKMNGENDLILTKIPGTSGFLNLDNIEFTEINSNTKGEVDGNLIFSSISNWFLGLEFNTDRLLVMNTTVADNELFYGKAYGRGTFEMFGPASDLEIYAHDVDVLKGSDISLNTGSTSVVEDKAFIQFYAYDETGNLIENEENQQGISGVTIDLSMNVDEGTAVNLVLDAQTDDAISARGVADDFKIQMNKAGKLNIDGEYRLSGGTYNYREYLVVDKDFQIEEGGFIRFNGDPYNAALGVRAVYSRYVNNVGDYLGLSNNQPTMVDLVIDITGSLENTDINFDILTPSAGSQISNSLKTRLSSTTDELMKQASFLLVLGRFGTDELLSAGTATGAATASAFELLGKQVGNIFSSIIPGLEINPTYLQATDRNQESDRIQTQLNWAINDRLRINGAVGAPIGTEYNEAVTTQVELDYDISEKADGGLILRGFSRPTTLGIENYHSNSTFAQSYGAGVIYTKSFNSFRELFKREEELDTVPKKVKDSVRVKKIDSMGNNTYSFIKFKE
ncbi:MAG: translocation/assembly module TamB domain-containing protein, partial [Weeksellaceae bacterium]